MNIYTYAQKQSMTVKKVIRKFLQRFKTKEPMMFRTIPFGIPRSPSSVFTDITETISYDDGLSITTTRDPNTLIPKSPEDNYMAIGQDVYKMPRGLSSSPRLVIFEKFAKYN